MQRMQSIVSMATSLTEGKVIKSYFILKYEQIYKIQVLSMILERSALTMLVMNVLR